MKKHLKRILAASIVLCMQISGLVLAADGESAETAPAAAEASASAADVIETSDAAQNDGEATAEADAARNDNEATAEADAAQNDGEATAEADAAQNDGEATAEADAVQNDGETTAEADAAQNDGEATAEADAAQNDGETTAEADAVENGAGLSEDEADSASEEETEQPDVPEYEDGEYEIAIESDFKMFKIVRQSAKVEGGRVIVTIGTASQTYDRIHLGSKNDENNYPDCVQGIPCGDGYDFTFGLDESMMGKTIDFVPGKPDGSWYSKNQYHLTIPTILVKPEATPAPEATPTPEATLESEATPAPEATPESTPEADVADGDYSVSVESSAAMFKVVACRLTAQSGQYTAVIVLSGTGYDYLFLGAAEEAEKAGSSAYIPFVENEDGMYTYAVPVAKLDAPVSVAAHSIKNQAWYDRTLTFKSEGMEKIGADAPADEPASAPTSVPTSAPTQTPEADLNGSTSRVDSSTTLADGVYAPKKFSYSGGTGRVRLSCTKVTVSGGRAVATLVFASPNFSYVKANGQKYYASHGGNSSTFEIPVKLNGNNRIIGMTTAMSAGHEVAYTIYISIDEPQAGANAHDESVPEIAGCKAIGAVVNEGAQGFAIYRYENNVSLICVKGAADYLIVPEGAELPVGADEGRVVIRRAPENVYMASGDAMRLLAEAGLEGALSAIRLTGLEAVDSLPAETAFAGAGDDPNYALLLKADCDLAVLPAVFADCQAAGRREGAESDMDDVAAESLMDVLERLSMLGIPAFADVSAREESERARLEWIKVYGVIFGCEDAANAAYAKAISALQG